MKLTKEEARWLDDKWNDFYYYFQVEDMFEKDQEIFNDGDSKIISSKIKTEDIDEVKEVSKWN